MIKKIIFGLCILGLVNAVGIHNGGTVSPNINATTLTVTGLSNLNGVTATSATVNGTVLNSQGVSTNGRLQVNGNGTFTDTLSSKILNVSGGNGAYGSVTICSLNVTGSNMTQNVVVIGSEGDSSRAGDFPLQIGWNNLHSNPGRNSWGLTLMSNKVGIWGLDNIGNYGRGQLCFGTNNDSNYNPITTANEVMRISNAGNVGIGTYPNAPSTKLEVAGTVSANQFGTGWTSFTPTLDPSVITFDSVVAYYKLTGRTVSVRGTFYCVNHLGANPPSNIIYMGNLPFPLANDVGYVPLGYAGYRNGSSNNSALNQLVVLYTNAYNVSFEYGYNGSFQASNITSGAYRELSFDFTYTTP